MTAPPIGPAQTTLPVDFPPTTPPVPTGGRASSRAAEVGVVVVWLAMLVWSLSFIQTFALRFPIWDEADQWTLLPPEGGFSWAEIWRPHNEHRIPLPRLLHYVLYRTSGSLLPTMWFQALLLAGAALALIFAARRARGSTEWTDAFFPLVWMHVGNCGNLLSGFQIALTLPTAITACLLAAITGSPDRPGIGRSVGIALGLVLLPLCGIVGILQASLVAVWTAWSAWRGLRGADPAGRGAARILLGGVLCFALLSLPHFWISKDPNLDFSGYAPGTIAGMAAAMITLGFGPAVIPSWPWSGIVVGVLASGTIALCVHSCRRGVGEPRRSLGIAAVAAGTLGLGVAIGIGRNRFGWFNGFAIRYVTLALPLFACAYLSWTLLGRGIVARCACAAFALVALVALPFNAYIGMQYGASFRDPARYLEHLVSLGAPAGLLIRQYASTFQNHTGQPDLETSRAVLKSLCAERRPPFDRGPVRDPREFEHLPP